MATFSGENAPSEADGPEASDQRPIPNPLIVEPDHLVENTFRQPDQMGDIPDFPSTELLEDYREQRFAPNRGGRIKVAWIQTGRSLPGIARVPNGTKEVTRWRKTKEWVEPFTPKKFAAIVLGSLALVNVVANHDTINAAVDTAEDGVGSIFTPKPRAADSLRVITEPVPTDTVRVTIASPSRVGSSEADTRALRRFARQVSTAQKEGKNLESIEVRGNASDEYAGDDSIGRRDEFNKQLAVSRAKVAAAELREGKLNVGIDPSVSIDVAAKEHILTTKQKRRALAAAKADGFPTITSAIAAEDSGADIKPSLAAKIKRWFTGKTQRGITLTANLSTPEMKKITVLQVENEISDGEPNKIPGLKFVPLFMPWLMLRRRQKETQLRDRKRLTFIPSKPITRPEIIKEDEAHAWVRLRPEAVKEDKTLIDAPWTHTRKFEDLLRTNRINDVLRADFTNSKGEEKALRIMFVDHNPSQETLEVFEQLLKRFAAMRDGSIADKVSGVFVYPSKNAGLGHGNPKRIGLGIDKQSQKGILGTLTPVMELCELHMPETWNPEELNDIFSNFEGPHWTLAHEVAGHGTDLNDKSLTLRPAKVRKIANAHVLQGDPWAGRMRPLQPVLEWLQRFGFGKKPTNFDITYAAADRDGRITTISARVDQNDPRLAHATTATIVGKQPTRYAGTDEYEHYAETAAAVTADEVAPFGEAYLNVPKLVADDGRPANFTPGYRPDVRGQALFTNAVGGIKGTYPIEFKNAPEVRISHIHPANDALIRREMIRSRSSRILPPEEMVAILAGIRSTKAA